MASTPKTFTSYMTTANRPEGAIAPVALYQFDGTGNSLSDRSGYGFDLTVQSGAIGSYITVPGSNCNLVGLHWDYDCRLYHKDPTDLQITGEITYELLMRPSQSAAIKNYHNYISVDIGGNESTTKNFVWSLRGAVAISGPGSQYDVLHEGPSAENYVHKWHGLYDTTIDYDYVRHICVTRNSSGKYYRFYIDGEFVEDITFTRGPYGGSASDLHIGGEVNPNDEYFIRGIIYGIRVTAQEWTCEQVRNAVNVLTSNYQSGVPIREALSVAPNVGGDFTFNYNKQIASQHRNADGNGVDNVPFKFSTHYLHIRNPSAGTTSLPCLTSSAW